MTLGSGLNEVEFCRYLWMLVIRNSEFVERDFEEANDIEKRDVIVLIDNYLFPPMFESRIYSLNNSFHALHIVQLHKEKS